MLTVMLTELFTVTIQNSLALNHSFTLGLTSLAGRLNHSSTERLNRR